jgi:sterol desaturase/sphingolipid hydroxylase (fatty acid hydroxylase superfamily)
MNSGKTSQQEIDSLQNRFGVLAKTSPYIIIPLDLICISGLLYYGIAIMQMNPSNVWITALGIFAWTLIEYLMHRYAFHFKAHSESGKKSIYLLHGIHHDHPADDDKLYQPPLVNFMIICGLFLFFYLLMGNYVFFFLPGIISGYLMYSTIHYVIHKFKPPFEWLKPLWRHHNLHHYRHQDKAFGVSSPLWDFIFRTMPDSASDR